jgi:hypothetical protein
MAVEWLISCAVVILVVARAVKRPGRERLTTTIAVTTQPDAGHEPGQQGGEDLLLGMLEDRDLGQVAA